MNCNQLLSGPFGLKLPDKLQYGKLLPNFLSIEEKNDYEKNCKKLGKDWQDWKNNHNGHIIESVVYTDPILFKNVPHGVDNRNSKFDRINLSVCFMEPYTYEIVLDLYNKGLLIK